MAKPKETLQPKASQEIDEKKFISLIQDSITSARRSMNEMQDAIDNYEGLLQDIQDAHGAGLIIKFYLDGDGGAYIKTQPKGHIGFGPHAKP